MRGETMENAKRGKNEKIKKNKHEIDRTEKNRKDDSRK